MNEMWHKLCPQHVLDIHEFNVGRKLVLDRLGYSKLQKLLRG
jgi:hypothetical protein